MIRKTLAVFVIGFALSVTSWAEYGAQFPASVEPKSARLLLSTENRMPALHRLELGAVGRYEELNAVFPDFVQTDVYDFEPYARFGLFKNFTVLARVPYRSVDPEIGDSQNGLGDVSAGFELVAYQDVFGFPYLIPHGEVFFDTGDEKKGLGAGETRFKIGASVGTIVEDMWHYVVDVSYLIGDDSENVLMGSGGIIWDLNKQCSLLAEGRITDEKFEDEDYTLYGHGGLTYRATPDLAYTIYIGAGDKEDVAVTLKIAYNF